MNPYKKAAILCATIVYLVACLLFPLWNNMFLSFIGEDVSVTTRKVYQNVEDDRFFTAIQRGDFALLQKMFSEEEKPNIDATYRIQNEFNSLSRITVLHESVRQPEILQFLIDQGADIDKVDERGSTPLMFAAQAGELESMTTLLKYGANPYIENAQGQTAVDILEAYKKSNTKVVKNRKWKRQYEKVKSLLNSMQSDE